MIVKITKLVRAQRETKKGATQLGITVEGIKFRDGVEEGEWSRFFTDQFDADIIASLEKIGTGNMADIKMEKNGQYWNPVSAKPVSDQGSAPKSGGPAPKGQPDRPAPQPKEIVVKDNTKQVALDQAVVLVKSAVELNAQDKMTLFPKGKMTLDLLAQEVLAVADMFEKFLSGKLDGAPKADAEAVKNEETPKPSSSKDEIPF